jgi:hypothetical protein
VNTTSLFVACCLTLPALLLPMTRATGVARGVGNPQLELTSTVPRDCGGEPCDAVARDFAAPTRRSACERARLRRLRRPAMPREPDGTIAFHWTS